MMSAIRPFPMGLVCLVCLTPAVLADASAAPGSKSDPTTYLLRYKFHPGESLRWEVLFQKRIQANAPKASKVTETVSKSVKVWRVTNVEPDGTATFEHLVENVEMRTRFSGGREMRYNSQADKKPPPGFQDLAESLGVPLAVVTIDPRGEILRRQRKPVRAAAQNEEGQMTIPLPDEAVPVGHAWSSRHEVDVPLEDGRVKKVKILQTFRLADVKTGVATINVATKVLTPLHSPALEAKLVDRESKGTVRLDLDAGRVLHQQLDVDRRVVGFVPGHPASSLHYLTRFTETFLPEEPQIASLAKSPEAESVH